MKITLSVKGFDAQLWFEVKERSREYGCSLPAMLERIVREWMAGKGRNG